MTRKIFISSLISLIIISCKKGMPNQNVIKKVILGVSTLDQSAQDFFSACALDGFPVTNISPYYYQNTYNTLIKKLKSNNEWSNKSFIYLAKTGDINWALRDIKKPSRKATMPNGTVTFTTNVGFTWTGTKYVDTGFDASTDSVFGQDSATIGGLTITAPANNANATLGCTDSSLNGVLSRNADYGNKYINSAYATSTPQTVAFYQYLFNGWHQTTRSSSSSYKNYLNSGLTHDITSTSVAKVPGNISWGALNRVGIGIVLNSDGIDALLYGGDGTCNASLIQGIFITTFCSVINDSTYTPYIITGVGDSMMGDGITPSYSNNGDRLQLAVQTLGTSWLYNNYGANGSSLWNWSDSYYDLYVAPYKNTLLTQVEWISIGTNDLAGVNDNGTDANSCMAYQTTIYNKAKTIGKRVILSGVIDRQGLLNVTYLAFNTQRDAFRTLCLTSFNIATADPLIWKNSDGNYFVDLWSISECQDSTNTTYFQADKCHTKVALDTLIAAKIAIAASYF